MIPYGRQTLDDADKQAVLRVLNSDFLTQGPEVPEFEAALSSRVGAAHSIAMTSATAALHAACLALDVGPGDSVWTSAISFVASANCAVYCGASVDFVDIDARSGNMSIPALENKLRIAAKNGVLPKVLIPVHFAGQPLDMESISNLGKRYRFRIIEDASHALGASYAGETVGNCRYSDITVFSFHPVKMITTAEGGAATTNDHSIATRLAKLRSHGITRDPSEIEHYEGDWFYDQVELGFNYRMTDMFAALGASQLRKLEAFLDARRKVVSHYQEALDSAKFQSLLQDPNGSSSWHLFVILVNNPEDRKVVFDHLRSNGILVNVHYRPIYRQSFYSKMEKYNPTDFPGAESYYSSAISLPIFPALSKDQILNIVKVLDTKPGYQVLF